MSGQGRPCKLTDDIPEECVSSQPDPMSSPIEPPASTGASRSNVAPRLAYDDLRQWLEEARRLGEVKEVSGLSWQQDIGLVAGVAMHEDGAPCFVFDQVPGTIAGSRLLVNFFGGKRKNMTLGFPTELSKIELSEGFRSNFMGPMTRIPPKYVDRRSDLRERHARRRGRRHPLSGAELARRATAAATSAPAASTSPATRTRAGSIAAPTG